MRSRAWRVGISVFYHGLTFCYHVRIRREVDFGYAHPGFDGGLEGGAAVRQRSGRTVADAHGRRHAQERFPLYHHHGGGGRDPLPPPSFFRAAPGEEWAPAREGQDPCPPRPPRGPRPSGPAPRDTPLLA